jgi:hypothetical protein
MPFSTYIRGVRYGRPTKTLQPIVKRLAKLTSAPLADLDDLVGTEVRATLPNGTERLYAVLAQDPRTGVLHLKDVEGHDTVISH